MKLEEIIKDAKKIGICGHVRPDGDCVGAALGIYNYITDNYKDVETHVYLEEPSPKLSYLAGFDKIEAQVSETEFDLFIAVDLGDIERMGIARDEFSKTARTVNIDHHMTNSRYASIDHVQSDIGSSCEVIYDMMEDCKISKNTAEAIYTGIVHDTGVFKYSSTTEHTMIVAGKLLGRGLDSQKIIDQGFYEKSYIQNQILGRALLESMIVLNGQCILSYLTKKDLDFYGVMSQEMDGIVEQLRLTSGVECAIFLYEINSMEFKISLRSKTCVNVNEVAEYFGGGGHKRAAGCTIKGDVHDAINNILLRIDKQIKVTDEDE